MFRWCPSTYRYIEGPLKPLPTVLRKRIPRIDALTHQNSDGTAAVTAFNSALCAGTPPLDALERVRLRVDPATFDECCVVAAANSTPDAASMRLLLQKYSSSFQLGRRLDPLARAASLAPTDSSASALELLAQPLEGYSDSDYSRLYDEMTDADKAAFDAALEKFNMAREPLLESPLSVPREFEGLLERWQQALQYQQVNGFTCLNRISPQIPRLVATLLVRVAAHMMSAHFPQSLTSLCRRIGFAIENGLLEDVAKQHNVKAAYSRSHYLWGLLGAPRWTAKDHIVVGSVYLRQALVKCTIDQEHPKKPGVQVARPAFWHTFYMDGKTKRGIVKINPAITAAVASVEPAQFTNLPMLVPPARWRTFRDGGYLLPRGQTFLPVASSQAVEQRVHVDHALKTDAMARNLDGVDALAKTVWAVNKPVLAVVQALFASNTGLSDLPREPLATDEPNERKVKFLERLQHKQALQVAAALAKHGQRFWLPLYQDFRGRVYPFAGTKFSFMGSDSMRALFTFWHGCKLGDGGLEALKVHLCNVYGAGTSKTYAERSAWVAENLPHIRASARMPLQESWWKAGSKPFQTLAACIELHQALDAPNPAEFISHLPVVQDGSCNGLQHYAALSRSPAAAHGVNMTAEVKPQDVYTAVADAVRDESGTVLSRSLAKRAVIAAVYGQGLFGVVQGLTTGLEETGAGSSEARRSANGLGPSVLAALTTKVADAGAVQKWLVEMGRRVLMARRADLPERTTSLKWTTPLGMPVVQSYGRSELMAIRTPLQAFYLQSPFHPAVTDVPKQLRAFPANFIHSLDASHLLLTAQAMRAAGHEIAAIHDGFWAHAGKAKELARILREQFVELHLPSQLAALKTEWEKTYRGYMVLVNVHASSAAYDALQRWRYGGLSGSRAKPPLDLDAELIAEYEKIRCGNLGAAGQSQILGAATGSDVVKGTGEQVVWGSGTAVPRIGQPHTSKTQVWLPLEFDEPPEGSYDVRSVLDAAYFFN